MPPVPSRPLPPVSTPLKAFDLPFVGMRARAGRWVASGGRRREVWDGGWEGGGRGGARGTGDGARGGGARSAGDVASPGGVRSGVNAGRDVGRGGKGRRREETSY